MRKTVLVFGLISGAMSATLMLVAIPFADRIGWEKGRSSATPGSCFRR